MAAQREDRFSYPYGENFKDSDRICVKCGCKRKSLDDSTNGTKKSKSLNEYAKERSKERDGFSKVKFHFSKNNSNKPPNLRLEVLISISLVESNEKGMMGIKREVLLVTKVLKSSGPIEVAFAAVRKHVDHDQFFCGLNDYRLCYPVQKIVQFIPGNDEFTVEL